MKLNVICLTQDEPLRQSVTAALETLPAESYALHAAITLHGADELLDDFDDDLHLVVASEFLFNETPDPWLRKAARRFPGVVRLVMCESKEVSLERLQQLPGVHWGEVSNEPVRMLSAVSRALALAGRDLERNEALRLLAAARRKNSELSKKVLTEFNLSDALSFLCEVFQARQAFFVRSREGRLVVEALGAHADSLGQALRDKLDANPAGFSGIVVKRLTRALQAEERPTPDMAAAIYQQGESVGYVYLEELRNTPLYADAHHDALHLIALDLAYLLQLESSAEQPKHAASQGPSSEEEEEKDMLLEVLKRENEASVDFAQAVQNFGLPPSNKLKEYVSNGFVSHLSADRVRNSYYWFLEKYYKFMVAVAESNEEGVPAAFVTLLCNHYLSEVAQDYAVLEPDAVLTYLHHRLSGGLKHPSKPGVSVLLLNIGFCSIDLENFELQFSGARKNMYLFHNGKLEELKGVANPLGMSQLNETKTVYKLEERSISAGDMVYLFNRGAIHLLNADADDLNDPARFAEFLTEAQALPADEQAAALEKRWNAVKEQTGSAPETLLIGIRVGEDA